ncbi:MAG TPA: GNAT family N-acetyltransferase [Acidimicrobiales bacterium]|jgi:GNAT superfamily N-acetyltransferase|nr:GNAT family N-acetyltransferase [Acidimicrobiales bacterium]
MAGISDAESMLSSVPTSYRAAVQTHFRSSVEIFDDARMPVWDTQADQYPAVGPAGLSYFRGELDSEHFVNCLLARDDHGRLIGILNHYPADIASRERRGNVNIWVHPEHQRQGIGSTLVKEMLSRGWAVNPFTAQVSSRGASLARRLLDELDPPGEHNRPTTDGAGPDRAGPDDPDGSQPEPGGHRKGSK